MTSSSAPPPRLTRIATRTGDDGSTGLGDGSRIAKHSPRIVALGEVDELNSTLGVLRTEPLPQAFDHRLAQVQHDLFSVGGELAVPGHAMLGPAEVAALDAWLAADNATLPPLREFILPGGCRPAALAHLARAQCRRAERALLALHQEEALREAPRWYLNRLSDWLFVVARCLNREAGRADVYWRRDGGSAEQDGR